jgi:hypothetical protein
MTVSSGEGEAAFFLAGDARLLQVELAFDASAPFIGDPAVLQQPVDVLALDGDQLRPELRCDRSGLKPVGHVSRQPPNAIVVAGTQSRHNLGRNSAVGRQLVEPAECHGSVALRGAS